MMVDPFWTALASTPEGRRAGNGGRSASASASTALKRGRELVLLDALSLLRAERSEARESGSRSGNRGGDVNDASGGESMVEEVSAARSGIAGTEPISESSMTEAIEPGSLDKLSEELSLFKGRGGTTGGGCLNGLCGSDPVSTVGESCSFEREYLRKWLPRVVIRFGVRLVLAGMVDALDLVWCVE